MCTHNISEVVQAGAFAKYARVFVCVRISRLSVLLPAPEVFQDVFVFCKDRI